MESLPNALSGFNSTALSYDPDTLRFGAENTADYFLERRRNRVLLQGRARLVSLQSEYARSYLSANPLTLLHYRDLLLSTCVSLALRSVQSRDVAYKKLTTHSTRYWQKSSTSFWSAVPHFEDSPTYKADTGFWGLAGSVAFELYRAQASGEGLYLAELIQLMLSKVWASSHLTDATAKGKQDQLLNTLQLTSVSCLSYENALTKLNTTPLEQQPSGARDVLATLRQSFLTSSDWQSLRPRLILGEYSDELLLTLQQLRAFAQSSSTVREYYQLPSETLNLNFQQLEQTLLTLLPPSGSVLVYQALAISGLLQVINAINNLSETDRQTELALIVQDPDFSSFCITAASNLATAYDACSALGLFGTLLEAKGLAYRFFLSALQWVRHQPSPFISAEGSTRLHSFLFESV